MTALTGTAGGRWVLSSQSMFCALCHTFQPRGWRYVVGIVTKATVCEECADKEV